MSKLIGTGPNQVPSNADLGDLAYQNSEFPQVNNIRLTGSMILGDEATAGSGVIGRNLTLPTGSSGDLFLFGPSPEIAFLDSNARRSSAIEGQDGDINFYSNTGDGTTINATVDGTSKATSDTDTLKTITINRVLKDANGNFSDGGDLNIRLGDLQIGGTSVIDASRRGTFGALGTTAAASALRIGMNNTNFINNTPTMQIYHYNYPDDNSTNVASLDIRVGNTDADLLHHGPVQLRQIFTGSARNSPMLQFWTNANSANDKGVIMLQGISGNVPGFYVYSDLIGSSESNLDLVPYNLFRTSANGSAITNNAVPTVNDGNNTLKLINDRSGSEQPGALGAGLIFSQRWFNSTTENVRAAGIYSYKTGGDGNFGGGLKIYTQPTNSGGDMAVALTIDGYQQTTFNADVYIPQSLTVGGSIEGEVASYTFAGSIFNEAGFGANEGVKMIHLGELTMPQGGASAEITLLCGSGYNGYAEQNRKYVLNLRTSNGNPASPFLGAYAYVEGIDSYNMDTSVAHSWIIEETASNVWNIFIRTAYLMGVYNTYTIHCPNSSTEWNPAHQVVNITAHTASYTIMAGEKQNMLVNGNYPAFSAYKNGTLNETAATAPVQSWIEHFDRTGHFVNSTGRFTAQMAGTYFFSFSPMKSGNTTGDVQYSIRRNGAIWSNTNDTGNGGTWQQVTVNALIPLSVGDYVEPYAHSNNNSSNAMVYMSHWSTFHGYLAH